MLKICQNQAANKDFKDVCNEVMHFFTLLNEYGTESADFSDILQQKS